MRHRGAKCPFLIMGFSLLNGMEFFAAPKKGIPFSIKPPAMRVRVGCYTKKLPFGLQSIQSGYKGYYFHSVIDCFMDQVQKKDISLRKIKK